MQQVRLLSGTEIDISSEKFSRCKQPVLFKSSQKPGAQMDSNKKQGIKHDDAKWWCQLSTKRQASSEHMRVHT